MKKYGDKLSNPVLLKLPNGSEWPVELRRWDGKAWFDNGWPDFSEFYSLRCGHWLVFQYEGNSKFNVFIFDRSCTEIDYPQAMPQMDSADQDDDSDDDLDDYSTHRGKSTLPCTRPHKKNRTSSSGKA